MTNDFRSYDHEQMLSKCLRAKIIGHYSLLEIQTPSDLLTSSYTTAFSCMF